MMKWKKSAITILGAALFLAGCGTSSKQTKETGDSTGDKEIFNIGITQISEHPSLDSAQEGFKKALEDAGLEVNYDIQNAQDDNSANDTIATNLVHSKVDLIFANSTPSAQASLSKTTDIPIIFTSVTDAVAAELVQSMEKPGGNVTGTIDMHPEAIQNTLKFMKEELGAATIGTIYNAGEQNSRAQVDNVKKILDNLGLKLEEASVATTADVKQAAESLIGKVDAFYIVTDNTVIKAIESVVSVADEKKLPLLTAELDSLDRGAFAAFGFDYYDIGYEAGEIAVQVLKGEKKPSEIPVQPPQQLKLKMNKKTAETIGVKIKPEWEAELVE
ncbi:putative ABC transport system substrate-binding protein [Bacillus chungangensis]|uniref:ABC transport system substrate-binding protein n=2 Tax=Bacillus chungangensis TaxID=587633 RepID=A0ABT9WTA9_9BACI|nr:putative ABC transport system substrate-binding protein [Bacillus chungangensis]